MPTWQLAQVNVARLREPLDAPATAGFVAQLEPINALADSADGFVWRLQDDGGDATAVRIEDDELLIVNLSVWRDLPSLTEFVYRGPHVNVMRRRREWFEPFDGIFLALWWIPAGHRPTPREATERLARLTQEGPGPNAFTFRIPFPAPDSTPVVAPDDAGCLA